MEQKRDLLKWQWPFFLIFFVINFAGLMATAYYGKDELHLHFNEIYHNTIGDYFFKYYTDVATTYVLIITLLYILWKGTWKHFIFLGSTAVVSSIVSSFVKRTFFVHGHRPTHYFELKEIKLRLVEGVQSQIPYTFPSGHTVLAVIICFYLCTQTTNRIVQVIICLLMGLVAIGRVYLSKHFVIDTIGGSMLGLFFAILGYYLIWNCSNEKLNRKIIPARK
ncbi:phosphatase PAP2 family protein [Moheibacter sediminis]|uniref:Membrane-associated phospholipid phosphatase n=1 Tax=Moheibacter sediminis TaxID=1434700 RepID=A0A1W1YBJ3_9FLAO|nr:phosphatase PAP2 family protein [Moheibacter sediminis]SMC33484.1 Membrane-associated phospholipid phosphatase [Moheibacter sediminis]